MSGTASVLTGRVFSSEPLLKSDEGDPTLSTATRNSRVYPSALLSLDSHLRSDMFLAMA